MFNFVLTNICKLNKNDKNKNWEKNVIFCCWARNHATSTQILSSSNYTMNTYIYIFFHLCWLSVLSRYSVVRNTWPCNSPSLNILFSTDNHCGSFCYTYIDTWRFHRTKKCSVLWTQLNLFFIFSTFFFCSELFLGLVKI